MVVRIFMCLLGALLGLTLVWLVKVSADETNWTSIEEVGNGDVYIQYRER